MLTLVYLAMIWLEPAWMYRLPEILRVVLILPFVPAMILLNTEILPAWVNYTLVPVAAFAMFWLMTRSLAGVIRWYWRAVKGPY